MMQLARPLAGSALALLLFLVLMQTTTRAQDLNPFVLVAAGDIAECGGVGSGLTAAQIDAILAARLSASAGISVAALGDLAYEMGTEQEFRDCYGPTWGRFRERTLPVVGNHEYETPGAAGYTGYFGAQAGDPAKLYYSASLPNNWLFIALNSNCPEAGGCGVGKPQEVWLRSVLAANKGKCIVAAMHQLPFSSGPNGDVDRYRALAAALYEYGADLLIGGHDHHYQRYVPMDHLGRATEDGFREFIIGTGGADPSREITVTTPITSATLKFNVAGVVKFELLPGLYAWEFRSVDGAHVDRGEGSCIGKVAHAYMPYVGAR